MKVRTRPLLLAAALLAGTVVPLSAPAVADTAPVSLGLSSLGRVVVDEAHGRVFVSGGPSGPGVKVTDLDGNVQTTLAFQGATGLALSPDGSRLWMAQPGFGLASIDPATLIGKERWPLAGCPGDVAVVGDRLVYGYSCQGYSPSGGGYGGIGVLDARTGASYGTATDGPYYRPVLAAGPAGQVYAADTGLSPSTLHLYGVGGSAPQKIASRAAVCSNLRDLSATPDGSAVVTSCGSPYQHDVWSSHKLEPSGTYKTGAYPLAGAWSADGRTFVAGSDAAYDPDVRVFTAGATTPSRTYDFGSTTARLQPRGLALSADGSRAWAVTSSGTDTLQLRVLGAAPTPTPTPTTAPASLSLASDPPSFFVGGTTRLGGWLSTGGTGIADASLTVTRTATGAAPVTLPRLTTAANGTYTFQDSPTDPGTYTYTVTWPAEGTRSGATATEHVTVHPLGTSLDLFLEPSWGAPDVVRGTLLLSSSSSTVSLEGRTVHLTRQGSGTSTVLPSVTTDEWGGAEFSDVPPPGIVTYTASVEARGTEPAVTATATITLLIPTTLQTGAPSTSTAVSAITVSGVLSTSAGGVGDAKVSVARSGCGAAWSTSAVTAMDGAWSVTDTTAPVGTCTWTASYAGDPVFAASTGTAKTVVERRATTLTVTAPDTGLAGEPLTVRGSLLSGATAVAGARVSVARSGCATLSTSAVTAADGSWSVVDTTPPGGTCTYGVSYAGSSTDLGSNASASTAVALRVPDLAVSVVRGTGSTKKLVHITGQLGTTHGNRSLTVTAKPANGVETFVASGTVDAGGRFTATYQPKTTTTYRVTFAGDDWYAARTVERTQ